MNLAFIPGFKPKNNKLYIIDTALVLFINMLVGLLVLDIIILPVVSVSALTRFIRYIYH